MSIKCNHPKQHLIIPNNNYPRVQIQVDHHQHVLRKNDSIFRDLFSVQRLFPTISVSFRVVSFSWNFFLLLLLFFYIYIKIQKRYFCHLSINCLFPYETTRISLRVRRPVNSVCVCVVDRSLFFSFFNSLDCFDNQHQFLPSTHTHLFNFSNTHTHTHTLI